MLLVGIAVSLGMWGADRPSAQQRSPAGDDIEVLQIQPTST